VDGQCGCFRKDMGLVEITIKCGNLSEMVSDSVVVATDHKEEVIYDLSNRGNFDDLESLSRSFLQIQM